MQKAGCVGSEQNGFFSARKRSKLPNTLPRELSVSTSQLASWLDVSDEWVRRLTEQGVLEKLRGSDGRELVGRYPLKRSVRNYISYLRERDVMTADEEGYQQNRRRKARAEADLLQLKLNREAGRMHHQEDIEFLLGQMITNTRSRLRAVPSRICQRLVGKTNVVEINEIVLADIDQALTALSERLFDPEALKRYGDGLGNERESGGNGQEKAS
jgi:phage terminase Nu1 subunit (DNA packaging protein)